MLKIEKSTYRLFKKILPFARVVFLKIFTHLTNSIEKMLQFSQWIGFGDVTQVHTVFTRTFQVVDILIRSPSRSSALVFALQWRIIFIIITISYIHWPNHHPPHFRNKIYENFVNFGPWTRTRNENFVDVIVVKKLLININAN